MSARRLLSETGLLRGEQEVARALRRGVARFETTRSASQRAPRAKRARTAAETPRNCRSQWPDEGSRYASRRASPRAAHGERGGQGGRLGGGASAPPGARASQLNGIRAAPYSSASGVVGRSLQAIAKAEAVRGNASPLVNAPMLCLCKPPGEEGLLGRIPLVQLDSAGARRPGACSCLGASAWRPMEVLPPRGRWSTGSATHAVADVGGLRCVDHPYDLQLDQRRQDVEQPSCNADGDPVSPPRPRSRARGAVSNSC
jgi:hypothetical protein